MQRLFILCFLISPHLFLAGCKQSVRQIQSVDPIVGAWITFDETRIIVNADGSGIQKFEREMYYELNKTYAGIETKLSWNSVGDSKYTIFYEGSKSPELCVIENGQLIFDQGDYKNVLERIELVEGKIVSISGRKYLGNDYSTKGSLVFFRGAVIRGADAGSIKLIKGPKYFYSVADNQGVYIYGKLLKGADPKTFTIDESEPDTEIYTMMDANHKWKFDPPAWPQLVQ